MKKVLMILLLFIIFTTTINAVSYKLIDDGYKTTLNWAVKRITIDNKVGYCIEPGSIEGTINYTKIEFNNKYDKLSKSKKDNIQKIGLYGEYYYKQKKDIAYYYAAQELIWDQVSSKQYRFKKDLTSQRNLIQSSVKTFDDVIKDNNKNFDIPAGGKVVINDAKFANYTITNKSQFEQDTSLKVTFNNNTLTIENPSSNRKEIKKELKFKKFMGMFDSGVSYAHYNKTNQNYVSILSNFSLEMKLDFTTKNAYGYLEGYKVDNHQSPLKDVSYGIYENDKLIEQVITNQDGYFKSKQLNIGKYQVKELKSLPSYELDNKVYEVEIKADQVSKVNDGKALINYLKKGKIRFSKVGENKYGQHPLAQIEYHLYDRNDNFIQKIITDTNGVGLSTLIEYGSYYLKESKTSEDYILDENKYYFDLNTSELILNDNKPFINQEKEYEFKIKKIDSLSKAIIKGAKFNIYYNNELFQSIDSKGEDILTGLSKGCYIIKEIQAPNNYEITNKEYKVCLDSKDYQQEVEIVIENEPIYILKIYKLDKDSSQMLAGVAFEITGDNFETKVTTNKDGIIELKMKKGCYDINEIKTLDNYILDKTKHQVCFTSNFKEELKVYNKKEVLVNTGSKYQRNYILVYVVGIMGVLIFSNYVFNKNKK